MIDPQVIVTCVTAAATALTGVVGYKGLKQKASIVYTDKLDKKQREYIALLERADGILKQQIEDLKGEVEHLSRACEDCSNDRARDRDKIIALLVELAQLKERQHPPSA